MRLHRTILDVGHNPHARVRPHPAREAVEIAIARTLRTGRQEAAKVFLGQRFAGSDPKAGRKAFAPIVQADEFAVRRPVEINLEDFEARQVGAYRLEGIGDGRPTEAPAAVRDCRSEWRGFGCACADILTSAPDFVTLQEISDANLKTIERLNAHFGSMVVCRASPSRGVALLAKHRIVEGTSRCYPDLDLVVTKVEIDSGPVWIASMHLRWPFPFDQHEQSRRISKILSELEGEVIVAGDFNMVREGSSVRRIGRASGANVAGERKTTFPRFNPVLPIEIDHVLLPLGSDAVVDLRPLLGSDHYGLFAVFSL
ncbi:hypothetical protein BOA8489_02093 [Boseongicola aestuarii]|uniref:Endonuclease/exonuclease/phosphatase domain-containing protein n=1 Tax=Boseongicola aestuarii TaxID=1470561 RepID=A0A238IZS3_9RHOB|nr:hypothetical protein BOA8489_02093 [Boseongicola aestuarii]